MAKVIFKAKACQFKNGFLLLPATPSDKSVLQSFCQTAGDHYITVTANYSRANKSYDQCKTIFALINILFEQSKDRKPTQDEQALVYSRLLWKYADRIEDPLNPEETVPISLSQMDKYQAAHFINAIMNEIYENRHGLSDGMEVDLKTIFEEFQRENNFGELNPIDYDKNGKLLNISEWRKKNNYSFASFVQNETLQLAHIMSRGSHPEYENCCWNWLMLTDYEHNRIQHSSGGGWYKLLTLYPHLAPRVKEAYDKGHELYPLDIQKALEELGLIDATINENKDEINKSLSDKDEINRLAEEAYCSEHYDIPEEDGLF